MEHVIQFPNPLLADDDGLVAIGGELSPAYLIAAYQQGIFPWFSEGDPYMWFSPNPRMVLFPANFKTSKSLRQTIRNKGFALKIDSDFSSVIKHCSKTSRIGQNGTWITQEMINAYTELHEMGLCHSFETYNHKNELIGGLYGVSFGKAFFGESMFYKENNASKFAFYHLVEWCKIHGFHFIDAQQSTRHLKSLGAEDLNRKKFIDLLNVALENPTLQRKWTNTWL